MGWFSKKVPTKPDAVKVTREIDGDGREVVRHEMTLGPNSTRPVREDVVTALDDALERLGGSVMHAMDPSRIMSFSEGGPPIWSVGIVEVPGPRPYSLLLTYGMSHVLSPEEFRAGLTHEFSLAVPAGTQLSPWADALLRHQCRYILSQGADIKVDDCVPLNGVPITRIPFQPQHHAMMPDSTLVGILGAPDPVLGTIATPAGPIEVRRLVGLDQLELDRVETWNPTAFREELARRDPLLLSPLTRASYMADAEFRDRVNQRAEDEGSTMDSAMFDIVWRLAPNNDVEVQIPFGRAARRLADAIQGRIGFGRALLAFTRSAPPIEMLIGQPTVNVTDRSLQLIGNLEEGPTADLFQAARANEAAHEPSVLVF